VRSNLRRALLEHPGSELAARCRYEAVALSPERCCSAVCAGWWGAVTPDAVNGDGEGDAAREPARL